jgi:hypothetical protein
VASQGALCAPKEQCAITVILSPYRLFWRMECTDPGIDHGNVMGFQLQTQHRINGRAQRTRHLTFGL